MKNFKNIFSNIFLYKEPIDTYDFSLPENNYKNENTPNISEESQTASHKIYNTLTVNIDYIKVKYNTLINSDIILREFKLNIKGKEYNAILLFIDGMIDSKSINDFILKPLMSKDCNTSTPAPTVITNNITVRRVKKFNLEDYIFNSLVPQNTMKKFTTFKEVFSSVNIGDCALFVDTLPVAFVFDVKGFESRSISEPKNEIVVRGSQESFVEKLRTNTSMIRR